MYKQKISAILLSLIFSMQNNSVCEEKEDLANVFPGPITTAHTTHNTAESNSNIQDSLNELVLDAQKQRSNVVLRFLRKNPTRIAYGGSIVAGFSLPYITYNRIAKWIVNSFFGAANVASPDEINELHAIEEKQKEYGFVNLLRNGRIGALAFGGAMPSIWRIAGKAIAIILMGTLAVRKFPLWRRICVGASVLLFVIFVLTEAANAIWFNPQKLSSMQVEKVKFTYDKIYNKRWYKFVSEGPGRYTASILMAIMAISGTHLYVKRQSNLKSND